MVSTMISIVALLALMIMATSAKPNGLELSLDRTSLSHEDGSSCSQLVCRVNGNSVSINSVTVRKVKVGINQSDLLAVTTHAKETHIRVDDIRGNGTLENNSAIIYIDLANFSTCQSDLVTCEVTYTTSSGHNGETFAIVGRGKLPKFQPALQTQSPVAVEGGATAATFKTGNQYLSELWYLGDKITKVETRFSTLSDRLESRIQNNMDIVQSRAGALENSVLERVSSVETDFSSRVSRLEDRLASILLAESPGTRSEVVQSVADMERRLEEMAMTLDQMNASKTVSYDGGHRMDQPTVCERGMGDDVTKTYPRYVMTHDDTIKRQVLCETETDGGGWIVIQRRAFGDVDFYRDWSSYREGFGSLTGDFYMGNEAIHNITDKHPHKLRIDFRVDGQELYAQYSNFRIEDESNKYRLRLGSYTGTVGETTDAYGFSYSNNRVFSTFDHDNDEYSSNCAISNHAAWWYGSCHYSNLNGIFLKRDGSVALSWYTGKSWVYPDFTEMKVRRIRPNTTS